THGSRAGRPERRLHGAAIAARPRSGPTIRHPEARPVAARRLKLATFNVNGIGARLPHLLAWLEREAPDVAALQELKAAAAAFPAEALEAAGYGALWLGQRSWNGVAILARDAVPVESRRRLPGDRDDTQSRYLEAAVHGVLVGALYLPNGNPCPGPRYQYKLAWMQRLHRHARSLVGLPHPVVLMGGLQRDPARGRCLRSEGLAARRAVPARGARALREAAGTGL